MARKADEEAIMQAKLWSALGFLAKKRADTDLFDPGISYVRVEVAGVIDRRRVTSEIAGQLILSKPTSRSKSEAPCTEHLVALLLDALPDDTARHKLMQRLEAYTQEHDELEPLAKDKIGTAKLWLQRLRSMSTVDVKGSLTFAIE